VKDTSVLKERKKSILEKENSALKSKNEKLEQESLSEALVNSECMSK
jgi:hypothetical protein